ncbi:hypothetical protein ACFVP0_10085 [Streptomyces cinereoruber]|uniref:hypothetical protein n=1 Tax=Streptomyces cinereoruber TaxID=67260 RepID=UPI0036BE43CC
MQMIDLMEQALRLGELPRELAELAQEIDQVRAGKIARPVREIVPLGIRVHTLSIRCLTQLDTLAGSQYAAMKEGAEALADMAETVLGVAFAAGTCTQAITDRTNVLTHEAADQTASTARERLGEASEELRQVADVYREFSQRLTVRLVTPAARIEDGRLIARALDRPAATPVPPALPSKPAPLSGPRR